MQWLVEHGEGWNGLDTNTKQMTDALEALGIAYETVKVVPFSHEVITPEGFDRTRPTMVYGSTLLAALAPDLFQLGAFYAPGIFDPRSWKHPYMLNQEIRTITAAELRRDWIAEPVFVKSVKDKLHTGMVLEPEDKDWWIVEQTEPDGEDELLLSPVQELEYEWRFFIVAGRVVAGSQYRHDNVRRLKEPVPLEVWQTAQTFADWWLPCCTVVMDLGRMKNDGTYRVVEFNCINSSGFYNSDVQVIVKALEEVYH